MLGTAPKVVTAAGLASFMLLVGGCAPQGEGAEQARDPGTSAAAPRSTATTGPEPVAAGITVTVPVGLREIEYTVGPLVNDGDLSILPITAVDVSGTTTADPLDISALWGGLYPGAYGVRLLDGGKGTVEEAAARPGGTSYYTTGSLEIEQAPLDMHVVFGAQSGATVDAIIPFAGLAADVPVVDLEDLAGSDDGADLAGALSDALDDLVSDRSKVTTRVATVDTFQTSVDGVVDTAITPDQVVITVSADVLFDVDQATISSGAEAALKSAAAQFAGYPAGTLTVVGHTDDVGEDGYNHDLSVRRAQAVADHLAAVVDLNPYTVAVEGRGESEPRAAGTSDSERAMNRRVELVFTPEVPAAAVAPAVTDFVLPESAGPSAPGAEGVTLDGRADWQAHVSMADVVRRGDLLIGEVVITAAAGEIVAPGEMFSVGSLRSPRGELTSNQMYTPANLTLVSGDQRFYPVDYMAQTGDTSQARVPLAEINLRPNLPEGGTYVTAVVWPVAAAGADGTQVVLDHFNPQAEDPIFYTIRPPFRLTDIPVRR